MTYCNGMKSLVDNGCVEMRIENIDNKGEIVTFNIRAQNQTLVMIKFCPMCGEKIMSSLIVPDGKCVM